MRTAVKLREVVVTVVCSNENNYFVLAIFSERRWRKWCILPARKGLYPRQRYENIQPLRKYCFEEILTPTILLPVGTAPTAEETSFCRYLCLYSRICCDNAAIVPFKGNVAFNTLIAVRLFILHIKTVLWERGGLCCMYLLTGTLPVLSWDLHFHSFLEAPLLRNPSLAGIYKVM